MKNTSNSVLVVAPHPDDETLGCGGTLLRHTSNGDRVVWLIVTEMTRRNGFTEKQIVHREKEISVVSKMYPFSATARLEHNAGCLEDGDLPTLIKEIGEVIKKHEIKTIYVPNRNDAHTDHRVCFDGVMACLKWFRYPTVKRAFAYETPSETEFGRQFEGSSFYPNTYVDITQWQKRKMEILEVFASELGEFPFPRSPRAVRAWDEARGASSGFLFAESFQQIMNRID